MDINSGLLTLLGELRVQVEDKTTQIGNLVQVNNDLAHECSIRKQDNDNLLLEIQQCESKISIMNNKIEGLLENVMRDTKDAS